MLKTKNTTSVKKSLLNDLKENAKKLIAKSEKNYYELGETLNTIKALTDHSKFSKFLEEEIDFSHNLANKYMRIASSYTEDQAVRLGVRKAYALLSLKEDIKEKFLKDHDVYNMTCKQLDEELKKLKNDKNVYEKGKAKNFIRNIESFKKNLSVKITSFSQYKYDLDSDLNELINENKEIFDKLEELNALICKSFNSNDEVNVDNDDAHDYKAQFQEYIYVDSANNEDNSDGEDVFYI